MIKQMKMNSPLWNSISHKIICLSLIYQIIIIYSWLNASPRLDLALEPYPIEIAYISLVAIPEKVEPILMIYFNIRLEKNNGMKSDISCKI